MSVEMACGSCQGRFLVTVAGTVACPHCGTHLMVSAADCPPSVDASTQTPVNVDESDPVPEPTPEPAAAVPEPVVPPEPVVVIPEPADPEAQMFANFAGLADAGQTEANESELVGAAIFPTTEPAVDETGDANFGEEQFSFGQDQDGQEQDIVPTPAEAVAEQVIDSTSDNSEAAAEPTIASVDSSVPHEEVAATDVPDFSALEAGENDSVPEEPPAEFPSFEFEPEAPTLTLDAAGQLDEGLGGEELPSAMFGYGAAPFEASEDNQDAPNDFPDFSAGADEDDGDNLDDLLAGASTEATIAENSLEVAADQQPPQENTTEPAPDPVTAAAVAEESETADEKMIPKAWFLMLASYASAMTIVCLWLLMRMLSGAHQLESLEDPAEATVRDGKKFVKLYQIDMKLPHGHVLRLGESRRFGNILVEPVKVTRGPLNFVYFSDEEAAPTAPPEATAATLKLWLRVENQSDDQTIAPLDRLMLFDNRVRNEDNYEDYRGNTFVCRAADKRKGGNLFYVYDLNTSDSWDLRGQKLEPLEPGESRETYIPSSPEGIDKLKGNLVWRVHLRKGYSPAKHGVTTLIEINFHSDEIQVEPSTAKKKQATASL
ncbi:MAG: hypothetical protein HON53_18770 [Planctomycetaceae bacterium]|nr:hypothetical protein [Planctomycetaceae bacterium]